MIIICTEETEKNGDGSDDEKFETEMSEIRFVPEDRGFLDAMYHAMTVCQTLHPDPNDSVSEGAFLTVCHLVALFFIHLFLLDGEYDEEDAEEGEYTLEPETEEHGSIRNNKNMVMVV